MTYTIGITTYDEWKELWGTDIGSNKDGPLYFTVWAGSEQSSRYAAIAFIDFMNESLKETLQDL